MVLSCPGAAPASSVRFVFRAGFALFAIAALSGCATSQASAPATRISASPQYVAQGETVAKVGSATSIEIEDDGLPAQTPPRVERAPEPDNPNEPYSPNYGRSAATLPAERLRPGAAEKAEKVPTKRLGQPPQTVPLPRSALMLRR